MNILHMMLNELKITSRNRVSLALLLVMPVMMISLMGYAMKPMLTASTSMERFSVLYVNEDQGTVGRAFDQYLRQQSSAFLDLIPATRAEAEEKLQAQQYGMAVVVTEDLSHHLSKGEKGAIQVISRGNDPIQDAVLQAFIDAFVGWSNTQSGMVKSYEALTQKENPLEVAAILTGVHTTYGLDFVQSEKIQTVNDQLSSFQFFAASMLVFFLLTTGMGVGTSIINERLDKTFMRIHTFPIGHHQYLLSKVLGNAVIGLLQAFSIMIFSSLAFEVHWGDHLLGIGVIILLVIFISSAISVLFSSFLNSTKALTGGLSVVFWFMTFISGGFTTFPVLGGAENFTVNKWAFDALAQLMAGGDMKMIGDSLWILLGTALILWTSGVYLYNRRVSHE